MGWPVKSGVVPLLGLLALSSCAGLAGNTQGPLQPQTVIGPCRVKPFFLLGLRSVPAELTVSNTGEACTMLLINPALNMVVNASLLTTRAQHGRAETGTTSGGRQALVRYVPAPGYAGTDRFAVTLEPNAVGITFNVTVEPPH